MSSTLHPCGVIFFDKPKGWTSRKAVNHIIHLFAQPNQKNRKQRPKAGHAGTLDPLATGMLPILLGEATRFASMGLNAEKCYEVSLDLSQQTDTLDLEGEVVARFSDVEVSEPELNEVLAKFRGIQQQTPPIFSAIKVDGKRAHALARSGEHPELAAREIEIKSLELLSFTKGIITLRVLCSKGTYIRSLARDIGVALGFGGCVTMLRRISSGGWPEQMMVSLEELEENKQACIIPLQTWLRDLPVVELAETEAQRFVQGQRLVLDVKPVAQVDSEENLHQVHFAGQMLGTATIEAKHASSILQPQRVLPSAQERLK